MALYEPGRKIEFMYHGKHRVGKVHEYKPNKKIVTVEIERTDEPYNEGVLDHFMRTKPMYRSFHTYKMTDIRGG